MKRKTAMELIREKLKKKMSEMYDVGFNPDILIVGSSKKKIIIELFSPYKISPNVYNADFGTLDIINVEDSDIIILDRKRNNYVKIKGLV